jgi:hypothetical protein
MKQKLLYILIVPLLVCAGCENKLEIAPPSISPEELILSTVDGIDGGLNFCYQQLHTDIGKNFVLWSEAFADHLVIRGAAILNHQYFYNRDLNAIIAEQASATDARVVSDARLRDLYNCSNAASRILRACQNDLAKTDLSYATNKNRIMGECYFLRAVSHFELVRFWAKAWGATPDNSHPGIVLVDQPVDDRVSQIKPRATLAQVYAFVIADLLKAESLLPETYDGNLHSGVYNGRAYKDAARGYLAKVYFQQLDYVKAKQMIDVIIGATPGTLTRHPLQSSLTQLFSARGPDNTDPECLYQTTSALTVNSLSTFWSAGNVECIYSMGNPTPKGIVSASFLQDAKFSVTDQRWTILFKTLTDGKVTPIKYSLSAHINIPVIRSAEMVLDRAEINVLDNKIEDAVNDCNAIRSRAQTTLLPLTITQSALLDTIKRERIRELAFEGDRLHNLRRMKQDIPPGERAGATPLPWNGLELVLKYSSLDIASNPLLENNY